MKMPTERQLRNLTRRVCRDFDKPVPEIRFVPGPIAKTHLDHIQLPSREWALEYRASDPMGYRLLMLHELAHWLAPGRNDDGTEGFEGHTSSFYARLYALCMLYGVPITAAYENEIVYKPRAARRGMEQFIREAIGRDLTPQDVWVDNEDPNHGREEVA